MNIIDISWPLIQGQTTEYKDRATLAIEFRARNEGFEESTICMGTHTGTHIEAPAHFIKGSKKVDQFSLSRFNGPCQVVDLTHVAEVITRKDLEPFTFEPESIVLLKTSNSLLPSTGPFVYDFVYLLAEAAEYLAKQEVPCVGIDYLSIERDQPDHPTHKALFKKDILIIEGLRLEQVTQGTYRLLCLPLNLKGTEAAPVRALLVS